MKIAYTCLGLIFFSAVASADPFLTIKCHSTDKRTNVDLTATPSCVNNFDVSGAITAKIDQTCDSTDITMIYTEASSANSIVVSASQANDKKNEILHVVSTGKITLQKKADQDYNLSFGAILTRASWQNGKKIVQVTDLICTGESFEQP